MSSGSVPVRRVRGWLYGYATPNVGLTNSSCHDSFGLAVNVSEGVGVGCLRAAVSIFCLLLRFLGGDQLALDGFDLRGGVRQLPSQLSGARRTGRLDLRRFTGKVPLPARLAGVNMEGETARVPTCCLLRLRSG